MNIEAIILEYFPDASEDALEEVLWTCTPFPFTNDESIMRKYLEYYKDHGGGSIGGAIAYAHKELDESIYNINKEI